jgi:LPS sulfotransferase NodH
MGVRDRLVASGKRFYCVCFSMRSGSTILCHDLEQWGINAPWEFFQLPERPAPDVALEEFLLRLVSETPGRHFGFKITWDQANRLTERLRAEGDTAVTEDLRSVFPDLRIVHLVRQDKVAQAVSTWRANHSMTWHWPEGVEVDPGRPTYNFEAIRQYFLQAVAEEWLWETHFSTHGISPYRMTYERYLADRIRELEKVAAYLAVPCSPVQLKDQLRVMRDGWSAEMVAMAWRDLYAPSETGSPEAGVPSRGLLVDPLV